MLSGITETLMSEPVSTLPRLPPELWEHILLQLTTCEAAELRAVKSTVTTLWHTDQL